jgi:hypothetical protein
MEGDERYGQGRDQRRRSRSPDRGESRNYERGKSNLISTKTVERS